MLIPFYKLQLGGNGFILVDTARTAELKPASYGKAAVRFCDRRYGVGASGCIFIGEDNSLRFLNAAGSEVYDADDAFFCAARYAFDSGRITETGRKKSITFVTARGDVSMNIISSREFKLSLGSPFASASGAIITPDSSDISETHTIDGKAVRVSAVHLHEDVILAFSSMLGKLGYQEFEAYVRKQTGGRLVHPCVAHIITRETVSVRTVTRGMSVSCAAAAAAVLSGTLSGSCDSGAVAVFEQGKPDPVIQAGNLAKDEDNSRRLAVLWDTQENEVFAVGTGGYLFEGKFDF